MLAFQRQRCMQANDVAFFEYFIQADKLTDFARLARWIADTHIPAQATQDFHQPAANFSGTDHAITTVVQRHALALGQRQQAAEHVVDDATRVASRRTRPVDAHFVEVVDVQMVGADGAGANEAHRTSLQQLAIDPGNRANQEHLGPLQCCSVDTAARHAANVAMLGKKGVDQWNVFVGKDSHQRAPSLMGPF